LNKGLINKISGSNIELTKDNSSSLKYIFCISTKDIAAIPICTKKAERNVVFTLSRLEKPVKKLTPEFTNAIKRIYKGLS
jgi:hypothetical protein